MNHMIKLLLLLLGSVTYGGSGPRHPAVLRPAGRRPADGQPDGQDAAGGAGGAVARPGADDDAAGGAGPGGGRGGPGRPRRIPRWLKITFVGALAAWVFRRAVAAVAVATVSMILHMVGISVHLPRVSFGWPWQTAGAGTATTTNTDIGPWVLQKIEGISKPALGQANFNFLFTHKVSKNIGPLPCWYASTFYAVGHASATVNLNPGPAWWAPGTGHYRLQVLRHPQAGRAGLVAVTMVLPRPQLPQSVHDVTIDNLPSRPVSVQHSWTYPGIACGMVLRPQFPPSVLYSQAQRIAFYRADHTAAITRPLISTAEAQAMRTIRGSFVQPAVNAFGYTLDKFTLSWAPSQPG
jgi:hypothetical protein